MTMKSGLEERYVIPPYWWGVSLTFCSRARFFSPAHVGEWGSHLAENRTFSSMCRQLPLAAQPPQTYAFLRGPYGQPFPCWCHGLWEVDESMGPQHNARQTLKVGNGIITPINTGAGHECNLEIAVIWKGRVTEKHQEFANCAWHELIIACGMFRLLCPFNFLPSPHSIGIIPCTLHTFKTVPKWT